MAENQYITPLYYTCAISFLIILTTIIFYQRFNLYRLKGWIGCVIFLFTFSLGGLICLTKNQSLNKRYFGSKSFPYLQIIVNDEPQLTNNILRFKADVIKAYTKNSSHKSYGKILIALKIDSLNPIKINYGDELIISPKYFPVEPPYNPYEFDFKSWLAQQNIYHQSFINQNQTIKISENKGNRIVSFALKLRKIQIEKYKKLIQNNEAFAVASTLVLGYRADLSKETLAAYSKTGTIHALSVSGAHVAIIFIVLNFCLGFLNRTKTRKTIKVIIICILIWSYALLTGFSPSVLRA
ncbi:MAG: ComEC family competence protein, partial [Sphingobacteriaceae bacterium]|nr:ComEC family competence protein [Sphingobacteriaceae bacterium]